MFVLAQVVLVSVETALPLILIWTSYGVMRLLAQHLTVAEEPSLTVWLFDGESRETECPSSVHDVDTAS